MRRTFCEAMEQDPALVLTMLDDLGYNSPAPRSVRAMARIRQDIEMGNEVDVNDLLAMHDLDLLIEEEIERLKEADYERTRY